jgi:hypothetical protein
VVAALIELAVTAGLCPDPGGGAALALDNDVTPYTLTAESRQSRGQPGEVRGKPGQTLRPPGLPGEPHMSADLHKIIDNSPKRRFIVKKLIC